MTSRVTPHVGSGRIMVTDGGQHPGEMWAQLIVDEMYSLSPDLDKPQVAAALRMRADMIEKLSPYFDKLMEAERNQLNDDYSRMVAGVDPAPHVDDMLKVVMDAAHGTRWEPMFNDSEIVMMIKQFLALHIATLLHGERSWHADRNADNEHAVAFRAMHHPGA